VLASTVLIQVDVQNVFYGSRSFTKNRGRVDYERLIGFLSSIAEERLGGPVETTVLGYVVQTPRYNGADFFEFLKRINYRLRVKCFPEEVKPKDEKWKGTVASMIQMDYLDFAPDYDMVIIVSGSGVFEPVFKASRANWPHVRRAIAAFDNTLHKSYVQQDNLVHAVVALTNQVLM
jgi:hypothetical protein